MKTGILTFHSAYNFGASLQAWALQTKLEELGVDAYMINYRPNIIDDLYNPMAHKRGIAKTRLYRIIRIRCSDMIIMRDLLKISFI